MHGYGLTVCVSSVRVLRRRGSALWPVGRRFFGRFSSALVRSAITDQSGRSGRVRVPSCLELLGPHSPLLSQLAFIAVSSFTTIDCCFWGTVELTEPSWCW